MADTVLVLGCDGYIGTALTQRLLTLGYDVIGVDNFLRRRAVLERKSFSAIPVLDQEEKMDVLGALGSFVFHKTDVALKADKLDKIISEAKPTTIVNLAHLPSGPYSHSSRMNSNLSLANNIIGTNNVLWSVKSHCPKCHYITIGSTGEYSHYSNVDIEEGYFTMERDGRESVEMIYPRRPTSVYHASKVANTYLIDFLSRAWDLRCTNIQQAVVFGAYTTDINRTKIFSRFDSDECFGTVINRFVVQAALGEPLTIYGKGKHQRGFLSLNDSVQALMIAVKNPPKTSRVQCWNQLSEWWSINEVAEMVRDVGKRKGLAVSLSHIDTPRPEHTDEHYYSYRTDILRDLGYKPTRTIEEEVAYCLDVIDRGRIKDLRKVVKPRIKF
jgi:UDP-sulfoquinovose synthase